MLALEIKGVEKVFVRLNTGPHYLLPSPTWTGQFGIAGKPGEDAMSGILL
jgi:hypothetical protein